MKGRGSLNHLYRLVWSQVLGAWIAVAETTKGRGKGASRKLLVAVVGLSSALAQAAPEGGQVVSGTGSIAQSGATTTITQATQNLSLNWDSFNIAAQETVNFNQPSATAIAVNRIMDSNGTQILGNLNANGQVYLINPNGILFGQGAQVNVGALVASTLDLNDASLNSDSRSFSGDGAGSVINRGTLNATSGGYVALLGNTVSNQGTITAPRGSVALGAGSAATLTFADNSLVQMQVDQSLLNNLADNGGLIQANGGRVLMSAGAKDALLASVVNNTGVIEARTVENHDGVIVLLGGMQAGTVQVAGTLDASAPNGGDGGFIETSAAHVKVADNAKITTAAAHGKTGTWLIDPVDFTIAAGSAALTTSGIGASTLSSSLGSTSVSIATDPSTAGNGDIFVNSAVSWSANKLTLSAHRNININANLNGSGTASLALEYGQAASDGLIGGVTASYNVNAAVNLAAGPNFSTTLGSAGMTKSYTVITSLGAAGSTTGTDLQGINGGLAANYALGGNIDAGATSTWNSGAGFAPIMVITPDTSPMCTSMGMCSPHTTPFSGTFDGLGHSISNLTINRPLADYVGLFGKTGMGSVIQNVGLLGGSVSGSSYIGGLVGLNDGGSISNSYATGSVSGSYHVGGLVGLNNGSISNSYATGSVSGSGIGIGGLVGYNSGSVSTSYATGSVSGSGIGIGGLVGRNNGSISTSYATGSVSGSGSVGRVGGLVGLNNGGSISNSYATGSVSGSSYIGGLVGLNNDGGSISYSYWDKVTSGQSASAGSTDIYGKTTAELLTQSTYTDWDFDNTWFMVAGSTRPFLRSEYSTTITNAHQLQLMSMNLAANYTLANNLDLAAELANPSGMWGTASGDVATGVTSGFSPIGNSASKFTGSFDGLGHSISNLSINRPIADFVGLFGYTDTGSVISNVGLLGGSVIANNKVGGLVGYNAGAISNSYATGSVTGGYDVGGLVGRNDSSGSVSTSYVTGRVTGIVSGNYTGGLVGHNRGTISNSYATGSVIGGFHVGGLVGRHFPSGTVSTSYATGSVSGSGSSSDIGGLVGSAAGTVSNSYWDTVTSGQSASAGGLGKTTAQLLTQANYAGFDFDNTWFMVAGSTRPFLRSEYSTTITNAHQLQLMSMNLAVNYTLANNLDLTAELANPSGMWGTASGDVATGVTSGFSPIGNSASKFTGSFDGLGHSISNLIINRPVTDYVGLFGYTGTGSVIRSVGLLGGSVSGGDYVGGLVGNNNGSVSSSYATGSVSGIGNYYIGGLVGINYATISNSYATGSVSGGHFVGGLVGNGNGGSSGMISNSYATGSVSGSGDYIGGLAGYNSGTISNNYAVGSVSGSGRFVGGLVGNNNGSISTSYATGSVGGSASAIGGLVGSSTYGTISNSYWDVTASGQANSAGGTGLSTAAMKTISSFSGWDIASTGGSGAVWRIYEGHTAPLLTSFMTGLTLADAPDATVTYSGAAQSGGAFTLIANVLGAAATGTNAGFHNGYYSTQQGYDITGGNLTIEKADLFVTGLSAGDKTYDANTTAILSGTASISALGDDDVSVVGSASGLFADKNVGTGKAITVTGNSLTGSDAGNYNLLQQTGLTAAIGKADLSVTGLTASGKTYDASTTATLGGTASIAKLGSDDVAVIGSASGIFASKNAGTQSVTVSGNSLTGSDAGNYNLLQQTGLTAAIGKADLSVTGLTASGKTYDANTTATLGGTASIAKLGSDDVAVIGSASGTFASKNAGTQSVTVSGNSLTGSDAGNYNLLQQTGLTAAIGKADLSVTGITADSKVYDGNTGVSLNTATASLNGLLAGDKVTVGAAGAFDSKNVGVGKTVALVSHYAGADLGNYRISDQGSTAADITRATLTYAATPASFLSGRAPGALSGGVSGFVSGETLASSTRGATTWTTAAGINSQPGVYAINGGGLTASNYLFAQAAGNASALTLTPGVATNPVVNVTTQLASSVLSPQASSQPQALSLSSSIRVSQSANAGSGAADDSSAADANNRAVLNTQMTIGSAGPSLLIVNGGVKLPDNMVAEKLIRNSL